MRKKNALTKRQLDVIDDLFAGEIEDQAVLEKHNVNAKLYSKWQSDDVFIEQFEKRIAAAHRQSAALIARYAPVAAAKLVQLTQSEKQETARKACLDIIAMQAPPVTPPKPQTTDSDQSQQLTQRTAAKILAILAEEDQTSDEHG
ncbi:MAG: hypothetical protein H8E73_01145 [Planctomycetes bacterium]|nr:hypothetical protein [Planctomycetota bacterium]